MAEKMSDGEVRRMIELMAKFPWEDCENYELLAGALDTSFDVGTRILATRAALLAEAKIEALPARPAPRRLRSV